MSTLQFDQVSVSYGRGGSAFTAVDSVSLTVPAGRIVGLVGESGSGKSTLAKATVGLVSPSAGRVLLDEVEITSVGREARTARRRVQMVFQDPQSCFNPRRTIGQSLDEALVAAARRDGVKAPSNRRRRTEIAELLQAVALPAAHADRLPSQLSGGQRQRVAVARAIAARPRFVLADEITSALDVSVQGSVLNLLRDLQRELGFGVLFISHNLAVVRVVCDEVAVMRHGHLIECGPTLDVLERPQQEYTRELIAAVPSL